MRNLFTVAIAASLMMVAGNASATHISVNLIFQSSGTDTLDCTGGCGNEIIDVYLDTDSAQGSALEGFSFSAELNTAGGVQMVSGTEYANIFQNGFAQFGPFPPGVSIISGATDLASGWDGVSATGTIGPCPNPTGIIFQGTCNATYGYVMGTLTY